MSTRNEFYRKYWDRKREITTAIKVRGGVKVTRYRRFRIHVIVSDHIWIFHARAIALGGRWRKKTGIWSFHIDCRLPLAALIAEHFGESAVPLWMREGEK